MATFLRKVGIEIDHIREGRARARIIVMIAKEGLIGSRCSVSQPTATTSQLSELPDRNDTSLQTQGTQNIGDASS